MTTCDGEHSRYAAYFVSVHRASSSSRSCTTVVLGCLGGAFKTGIAIFSFLYSELLHGCMQVDFISVCTRAKHGHAFCVTGGSDPEELWAAESRPFRGRSRPFRGFGRVHSCCPPSAHLLSSRAVVVILLRKQAGKQDRKSILSSPSPLSLFCRRS